MAAVAVLLMNIENRAVTRIKPSSTFSDLVPNGASITLASFTSRPLLVAAMAIMKPPIKSMIVGSAKQCSRSVLLTRFPNFCPDGSV